MKEQNDIKKYALMGILAAFKENNITPGVSMDFIVKDVLTKLGFKKQAEFDPTATHQQPDNTSIYKKINHIPTTKAIEALGQE